MPDLEMVVYMYNCCTWLLQLKASENYVECLATWKKSIHGVSQSFLLENFSWKIFHFSRFTRWNVCLSNAMMMETRSIILCLHIGTAFWLSFSRVWPQCSQGGCCNMAEISSSMYLLRAFLERMLNFLFSPYIGKLRNTYL